MIMRSVTTGFASLTFYSTSRLFWQDRNKSLLKVKGNLFGGYLLMKMLIQLAPEYLSYYRPSFHPATHDYSQIVNYWKQRLVEDYQMKEFLIEAEAVS